MPGAFAFGCAGPRLLPVERAFFREADPWGFILFGRNCLSPGQLRRLTDELRDAVGRDAPVMIDQEGGRVQRMGPPSWDAYLPALDQMRTAGDRWPEAMVLRSRLIAQELMAGGVDVNCTPLADLVEPQTHPVLRNRLYGAQPDLVVAAARAVVEGQLMQGVLPVLKHVPGYGRAAPDPHLGLARLTQPLTELEARDFAPFRALADLRMVMTAHIVIEALDADRPATTSSATIRYIREAMGLGGLLMTDDISMGALSGTVAERGAAALAAGCDLVLHCNGTLSEMEAVAALGPLSDAGAGRAERALAERRASEPFDRAAAKARLAELIGPAAA